MCFRLNKNKLELRSTISPISLFVVPFFLENSNSNFGNLHAFFVVVFVYFQIQISVTSKPDFVFFVFEHLISNVGHRQARFRFCLFANSISNVGHIQTRCFCFNCFLCVVLLNFQVRFSVTSKTLFLFVLFCCWTFEFEFRSHPSPISLFLLKKDEFQSHPIPISFFYSN